MCRIRPNYRSLIAAALSQLFVLFSVVSFARAETVFDDFRSQNQDFFRLVAGEGKDLEMRFTNEPQRSFNGTGAERAGMRELLLSAEFPWPTSRDFFFRLAPYYQIRWYDFDNLLVQGRELQSLDLHRLELGAGAGYFVSPDWLVTAMIRPGFHSNFSDGFGGSQLFSNLFVVHRYTPNVELVAGVVNSKRFPEVELFPVLGARIRAADGRWHLKITPPVELRYGYNVARSLQLYGGFWVTGDEYRIYSSQPGGNYNLQVQDKRLGTGLLYWLNSNTNLSLELGAALIARLTLKLRRLSSLPINWKMDCTS